MKRPKIKDRTVAEWFQELEYGLDYRSVYGLEDHWPELERLFYHVHESLIVSGPNIIASTGDALLSHLTVPRPRFIITPQREDQVLSARVVQQVDNMLVGQMKMRESVQRAVVAAFCFGVGFLKVGYDSEFGYDASYDVGGKHRPLGLTLTQMDRKGRMLEFGKAVAGMPWVDDVLPHDVIVPYGVKDIDHAEWIAHRFVRHVDDIRADVKYENTGDLMPTMSREDFVDSYEVGSKPYKLGRVEVHGGGSGSTSRDAEYCECFEIHERRTGKVIVIATGHDEFLRHDDDLLQTNGLPFVSIRFTPYCRNFWVTPDAFYLKAAQAELTDISVQSTKQRRAGNLRFAYMEGAIDPREMTKAMSGDVGVGFKVNKQAGTLENAIKPFQPGTNMNLYAEKQNVRQDAGEIVGMPRNQLGEFEGSSRRTAREVMEVKGAASLRMSRRQLEMAELFTGAIRKANGIIFENWTAPRVAQVVGMNGAQVWQQFTGPEIRGEYMYDVAFTTEGTPTIEEQRQQAMQEYSILSQDPRVDPVQIAQYLTGKYQNVDFSSIFKPGVANGTTQVGSGAPGTVATGQGGVPGSGGEEPPTQG